MIRPILQTEVSECALACLAMICNAHGGRRELAEMRRLFPVGLKGATLDQVIQNASALKFSARPVRLELEDLKDLQLPAMLHWDLNHFVVLAKVNPRGVLIFDPAVGERRLSLAEISAHFTGIALELRPTAAFSQVPAAPTLSLRQLTGRIYGLKTAMGQIFVAALALELFAIAAPLFSQLVIDDVLTTGDQHLLTVLTWGFLLMLVIQMAITLARGWMTMALGNTLSLQWKGNVFAHLIRLPVEYFEKRHLGDVVSRFGAVSAIQKTLTTGAIEAILDGFMAIIALVLMSFYSIALTGIVAAAAAAYGVVRWAMYASLRNMSSEKIALTARESSHFLETLRAVTPLKLFNREQERMSQWQNHLNDVQNKDWKINRLILGFSVTKASIFGLENLLVIWLGARIILDGSTAGATFTVGMLFAFISFKNQFSTRLAALIDYVVELKMLSVQMERLADIVLTPAELEHQPRSDLSHLPASLELRNASFRYSPSEPWILKNCHLTIHPGENVAITGPSGSGKTTLLKILIGLLEPTEGDVLFGGIPIQQLGVENVRRQIGAVMQEDSLLTGTLSENISFFDSHPDPQRVVQFAAIAQLHEDICKMPMGYQTLVGDLGSGLSGGQKQRLLLARALYKNPRVLALDEATSHLDVHNERAITSSLANAPMTRLAIAHREETIRAAERVIVLSGGAIHEMPKVADRGTSPRDTVPLELVN